MKVAIKSTNIEFTSRIDSKRKGIGVIILRDSFSFTQSYTQCIKLKKTVNSFIKWYHIVEHVLCKSHSMEGPPPLKIIFHWRWFSKHIFFHLQSKFNTRHIIPLSSELSYLFNAYTLLGAVSLLHYPFPGYFRAPAPPWYSVIFSDPPPPNWLHNLFTELIRYVVNLRIMMQWKNRNDYSSQVYVIYCQA